MPALFGAKLAHLRTSRGLSQADLTRLFNVGRAHISNLESGRRAPSLNLAIRCALLLAAPVDYLLRDEFSVEALHSVKRHPAQSLPSIGLRIRALRLQQGLRQGDLAASLGLQTQAHVSLIETGQKEPSIELFLAIADYFGVSAEKLVFEEDKDAEKLSNIPTVMG